MTKATKRARARERMDSRSQYGLPPEERIRQLACYYRWCVTRGCVALPGNDPITGRPKAQQPGQWREAGFVVHKALAWHFLQQLQRVSHARPLP